MFPLHMVSLLRRWKIVMCSDHVEGRKGFLHSIFRLPRKSSPLKKRYPNQLQKKTTYFPFP
uniref:Uncharacterized protein n=1 Tax=Cucumis melo TaxID=3656 RepID=A0A9I9EC10_CUCME